MISWKQHQYPHVVRKDFFVANQKLFRKNNENLVELRVCGHTPKILYKELYKARLIRLPAA